MNADREVNIVMDGMLLEFNILHFFISFSKFFYFTNTTHSWHPYLFKTSCFLLHFDYAMATLSLISPFRLKVLLFWIFVFVIYSFWGISPIGLLLVGLTFIFQLTLSKLKEASLPFLADQKLLSQSLCILLPDLIFLKIILLVKIILIINCHSVFSFFLYF